MFSQKKTDGSTKENYQKLKEKIDKADAVVIGAGAGLSASAGFEYSGRRFSDNFADFEEKYGFHDMYSGGFYPFEDSREFWAYWSRYILINRYKNIPKPEVFASLLSLVKDKNYFVITTNVDHCFQKSGFDKERLFYVQGDYGLFQCSEPCRQWTYENENAIKRMVSEQKDMKIPEELIPRCPVCGKPLTTNLRCDNRFAEDAGWHAAYERYKKFLRENSNGKILFLELGVGYNTPGIIKYPFIKLTADLPDAYYITVNKETYIPSAIKKKSTAFSSDIGELLTNGSVSDII